MNQAPQVTPESVKGRVVVAMSGGVDSSVAAAMMHAEGWDVVGVAMRLYADAKKSGKSCCSPDDLFDARAVAERAGFPFYVANYQEAFEQLVIQAFVDEYRRGRTPSPCVLCNDHLKFAVLFERTGALGAEYLVTGHYARIEEIDGRFALLRGADRRKDQSYFLFGLARESLARIRFPLGAMTKDEVREIGRRLDVPTAEKSESQDICFVAGRDYAEFVASRLKPEQIVPGLIADADTGQELGRHDGIHHFTVGQRRGIGVAHPEPLYVKSIDAETGTVFVGTRERVGSDRFEIARCNWLRWPEPPTRFAAEVQVRYRQLSVRCEVSAGKDGTATVHLPDAMSGIAPGQAAVFYDGDEVLGGGWIEAVV